MKRFRKKRGSSLILVVFITAIVFTVATTMIAVVTNDYKTRINESKQLQNLYQSDAKIDLAYNIIARNAKTATTYAYNCAYQYNEHEIVSSQRLKEYFSERFFDFLTGQAGNAEGDSRLEYAVANNKEYKYNTNNGDEIYENLSQASNYDPEDLGVDDETTGKQNNQNSEISVENIERESDKLIVTVKSTIYNKTTADGSENGAKINGKLDNKKIIMTKFSIKAPDYVMPASANSVEKVETYNYAVQKAITADGNLNIIGDNDGNKTSLKVSGTDGNNEAPADIWIKGNEKQINKDEYNVAYDKYAYGIRLNNAVLDVNGNVITNSNLSLSNNSSAAIGNNVYAHNAYVGPIDKSQISNDPKARNTDLGGDKLDSYNLYTNNDLVMNSDSSDINITNYVGISDKKEESQTSGDMSQKIKAARNSSSIIVNPTQDDNYKSHININNATVAGFAYMNTPGSSYYTTGESVATKGNYLAYSTQFTSEKEDSDLVRYDIQDYDPLYLIEYKNDVDSALAKANHFEQYYGSKQAYSGGVKINSLLSTGAAAYKDANGNTQINGAVDTKTLSKISQIQNDAKKKYASNVYNMGQNSTNDSRLYANVMDNKMSDMKTVCTEGTNKAVDFDYLEERINANGLDDLFRYNPPGESNGDGVYNGQGYCILNADADRDVTIKSNSEGGYDIELQATDSKAQQKVSLKAGEELRAVVITKGNVNLDGDFTMYGSIIAGGDVNVKAGSKINIVQDNSRINQIIANHIKYFKNENDDLYRLFTGNPLSVGVSDELSSQTETVTTVPYFDENTGSGITGAFNAEKCIKRGLWRLVKDKASTEDE